VCGFAAIYYASKPIGESAIMGWSTLTIAGALVLAGMLFDGIDGFAARLTRSASEFGAQLDSMADMVTFGVAPAFMMLRLVSYYYGGPEHYTGILGPDADNAYGKIIWGVAAFYICCTALRLARFNAETPSVEEHDHRYFRGLPSPGAGGTVASLTLLHQHLMVARFHEVPPDGFERTSALLLPLATLLVSAAMISRIRYWHLVNRYLRGRQPFGSVAWALLPIAFAVWWFQVAIAACFSLYAISGPLVWIVRRWRHP
jgi:CDP-diacylglycerol--serine O-phosphatidyltransferase